MVLNSYVFNNYKLLRVSDIGQQYDPETEEGSLGRSYCYQIFGGATGYFDEQFNTFMGAGALGMAFDDFNGDNFDHPNKKNHRLQHRPLPVHTQHRWYDHGRRP